MKLPITVNPCITSILLSGIYSSKKHLKSTSNILKYSTALTYHHRTYYQRPAPLTHYTTSFQLNYFTPKISISMSPRKKNTGLSSLPSNTPSNGIPLRRSSRLAASSSSNVPKKDKINKNTNTTKVVGKKRKLSSTKKTEPTSSSPAVINHDEKNSNPENLDQKSKHKPNQDFILLDLGTLIQGTVIRRPSQIVKSPYVADVQLLYQDNTIVQAHAPALDVGGLCSPGSTVHMTQRPPGGKTSHSIELVESTGPFHHLTATNNDSNESIHDDDMVLVGAHPRLGEVLAEKILSLGLLHNIFGFDDVNVSPSVSNNESSNHDTNVTLKRQCTFGDSRVDFELIQHCMNSSQDPYRKRVLVEVKNVVCSDYSAMNAPKKQNANHCVIINNTIKDEKEYKRCAIFPWGKSNQTFEGKKVVSERAIKHLRNLANIVSSCGDLKNRSSQTSSKQQDQKDGNSLQGKFDENDTVRAVILFIVNRSDCEYMRPCHEACPMFASELKSAVERGCMVVSVRIRWTRDGKAYFDGIIPTRI